MSFLVGLLETSEPVVCSVCQTPSVVIPAERPWEGWYRHLCPHGDYVWHQDAVLLYNEWESTHSLSIKALIFRDLLELVHFGKKLNSDEIAYEEWSAEREQKQMELIDDLHRFGISSSQCCGDECNDS